MGNPWAPPQHPRPQGTSPQDAGAPPAPGTGAPQGTPPVQGARPAHGTPPASGPAQGATPPGAPVGPPGPHGGPPRPAPPEPDPAGIARSTRTAAWGAVCLLVAVLLVSAPYPWAYATPLASLAALALGIVAVVRGVQAHARGAVVALTAVLVVAAVLWTLMSVQVFVYSSAREAHQECRSRALTVQAERVCDAQLVEDLERTTRSFLPTAPTGA
ncbi:hypothetical protein ACFUMH_11265 [Cellulomonas sp. NPDC057328]|uniref:hypothetical protein n=1 Tax=Cellulomonas sp. NPDC057328 TaxID=3346101 RepID=UPI003633C79C